MKSFVHVRDLAYVEAPRAVKAPRRSDAGTRYVNGSLKTTCNL